MPRSSRPASSRTGSCSPASSPGRDRADPPPGDGGRSNRPAPARRLRRHRRSPRTSPRACAPARRPRRRTPARRRTRRLRPRAARPARGRSRTPMVDVSTTAVTRRATTPRISPTTDSLARPSGRLSTITSAARGELTDVGPVGRALGDALGSDHVVGHHGVTARHQVRRQHAAHVAQADEPDGRHRQPPARSARTARISRRAATAAGAPQYAAIWNSSSSTSSSLTPGLRGAARVETELLHPTERGRHRHHQQAPVACRQRTAPGPHPPRIDVR